MGEAKRRREKGFGYDLSPRLLYACYIAPAIISDRHAVYLGIRRNSRVAASKPLSVHTSVTGAWKVFTCCQEILRGCCFSLSQSDIDIFRLFTESLHNTCGNHSEEGDRYKVSGDLNAYNAWMSKGHYRDKDSPPPGVKIIPITEATKKRYRVFCIPVKGESKDYYGNPDDNCIFHVGEKYQPLMGENNDFFVWQSYVKAAYAADFANTHNKDRLTSDEIKTLRRESERLFGDPEPF